MPSGGRNAKLVDAFDPETGMELRTVLLAISTEASQIPSAANTPLTVRWDTIVFIDTDYVTLTNDASGRQGLITFQKFLNVSSNAAFDYVKTGGTPDISTIFGRRLINSSQSGTTVEKDLPRFDEKDNFVDAYTLSFDAGDTLQYDLAYLGDEAGLVQNAAVPTGFDPVPCTAIRLSGWFPRNG